MSLQDELADAEAAVVRIKRQIAQSSCHEVGHDWKHIGGRNAGCELGRDCFCSIPVHRCRKCRDCDYGENPEAEATITHCREIRTP